MDQTGDNQSDLESLPKEGLVIPTSQGLIKINVQSLEGTAAQHLAAAAPTPLSGPVGMPLAETIAWAVVILAACYLIASLWFKRLHPAQTRTAVSLKEKSGLLDGNYPIVRVIGQGGMGIVYEAVDRVLDRKVAIKKMRDEIRENIGEFEQFLKEAKTVASLHHPAIVDIHTIIEQGGEVYLVFEYVEGKTVEALLAEKGRFSLDEAKKMLEPICQALDFAHGRNVVHRDLKPSNVMVTHQGFVKVMDFGIARRAKDPILKPGPTNVKYEMTQSIAGTPLYMAPEAEKGMVCPQSDIYSLGVMAYQMLSGKPPFFSPVSIEQKTNKEYLRLSRRMPDITNSVSSFIDSALEPEPEKRIPSAREFWNRLSAL